MENCGKKLLFRGGLLNISSKGSMVITEKFLEKGYLALRLDEGQEIAKFLLNFSQLLIWPKLQ